MSSRITKERKINIAVLEHKQTHLLVATSEDMPGLYIAARSEEQIERELPDAIREILEAEGRTVVSVTAEPKGPLPRDFQVRGILARAWMEEMAHG